MHNKKGEFTNTLGLYFGGVGLGAWFVLTEVLSGFLQ